MQRNGALQHGFSARGVMLSLTLGDSLLARKGERSAGTQTRRRKMLRTFAAVLLATSLVAGTAFAAEPPSGAGAPPPAATATGKTAAAPTHPAKPGTLAKHARKHMAGKHLARKHLARVKHRSIKTVHHVKGVKTHKTHVAKSARPAKTATRNPSAGVKTARLPAARSGTN